MKGWIIIFWGLVVACGCEEKVCFQKLTLVLDADLYGIQIGVRK